MAKKKRNYYPINELNAYLLASGWGSFDISEESQHSGVAVELTQGLQSLGLLPSDWVLEYQYLRYTRQLVFSLFVEGHTFLLVGFTVHKYREYCIERGGGDFLEILTSRIQEVQSSLTTLTELGVRDFWFRSLPLGDFLGFTDLGTIAGNKEIYCAFDIIYKPSFSISYSVTESGVQGTVVQYIPKYSLDELSEEEEKALLLKYREYTVSGSTRGTNEGLDISQYRKPRSRWVKRFKTLGSFSSTEELKLLMLDILGS